MAIFRKQLEVKAYNDNFDESFNIGNAEYLRRIEIEFAGSLVGGAGTTDATLIEDGLLKTILKKIRLTANGSDNFVDTDGVGEYFRRAILSGSAGVLVSTVGVATAAAAQRVHVVLDMESILSGAKFSGRIPAGILASLILRLEGGAVNTDMVTGGDRTYSLTGTYTITNVFDSDPKSWKGGGRRISKVRYPVTASNNKATIPIPVGQLISRMMLVAVDNSLRNNALVTDVKVRRGERDERIDDTFLNIQSDNVEEFGLELSSGAPPYTGIALLNFDFDGDMRPAKVLNTTKAKVEGATLELNIGAPTGTAYVDVYTYATDPKGVGR